MKIAGINSRKFGDDNYEGELKNNYLYNDKELFEDADINWYDYGFRNYDPQIGRFPQLDPLTDDYPYYTPYQYAGNEPIANVDLDGLEEYTSLMPVVLQGVKNAAPAATTSIFKIAAKVIPVISNIASVHSEQSLVNTQLQSFLPAAQNGSTVGQCCNYYVSDGQKSANATQTSDAGYNPDGSKKFLTRAAENRTVNNLANNVFFSPAVNIAGAAVGIGELRSGFRLLKFARGGVQFSKVPKASELRIWAQEQGYGLFSNKNGIETWGVKGTSDWRLKLKPPSTTPGIDPGSQKWRFSARTAPGKYYNPVTGQSGTRT